MPLRIVYLLLIVVLIVSCGCDTPRLTGDLDGNDRILAGNFGEMIDADYALLIASDGIAALIPEIGFTQIELIRESGVWRSEAKVLPAFCSIDSLKEICLFRVLSDSTTFHSRIESFERIGGSVKNNYPAWKYRRKQ